MTSERFLVEGVGKGSIPGCMIFDVIDNVIEVTNAGFTPYRLLGPNHLIWTSKIKLYKRKFGRPSIRTVQSYG